MEGTTTHQHETAMFTGESYDPLEAVQDITLGNDRDRALQLADQLEGSGFKAFGIVRVGGGQAWAVEAYSADQGTTPLQSWWTRPMLDRLGAIAEETGADLNITCRSGRMTARFT